jgi:hypothetical protein
LIHSVVHGTPNSRSRAKQRRLKARHSRTASLLSGNQARRVKRFACSNAQSPRPKTRPSVTPRCGFPPPLTKPRSFDLV